MTNNIVDLTFGVRSQALSVLYYMKDYVPDFAEFKDGWYRGVDFTTKPWYNGREDGIVISMCLDYGQSIHIAFFEHRNGDSIHCLRWETKSNYWNHPLEDPNIFDVAYGGGNKHDTTISFPCGAVDECATWIYDELERFYIESQEDKGLSGED